MEFKAFSKIDRVKSSLVIVSQKIHGTNASVCIYPNPDNPTELLIKAGKRTSWITVENDNFGFAKFVEENKEALIKCLGEGMWFGEWAGPGINSGEGLTEKRFLLFDTHRLEKNETFFTNAPKNVGLVPVLWKGTLDQLRIDQLMEDLKTKGSMVVAGFMRPEGLVVNILGIGRMKFVFDPEETQWTKGAAKKVFPRREGAIDVSHLLQPIRLEKLLSRDEAHLVAYPASLPNIASAYVKDLEEEGQLSEDEDERKEQKRILGRTVFPFIRSLVKV